ncbi:hypothetical protein N7539_004121 [Penicillium diatomitis]|uniref:Thioesterase domain-containing protein n=1 Tax=Penicillium diatomitis TaxID=2819901 RepID=A0A9W9XDA5_9EURO|nr:uncharacterized protein N7539_004121 [Penicillium diatomitis]KAJ5489231.1 hypothetical protein N7539_004121 [Penicillium diatomitis]
MLRPTFLSSSSLSFASSTLPSIAPRTRTRSLPSPSLLQRRAAPSPCQPSLSSTRYRYNRFYSTGQSPPDHRTAVSGCTLLHFERFVVPSSHAFAVAESISPAHSQTPPPPPPPRSRFRRFLGFTSIAVFAFSVGLLYQTQRTVSRLMASPMISNAESVAAFVPVDAHAEEVDEYLRTHPEAAKLRADPEFEESRPHLRYPEAIRARSLTAGTLAGPNKLVVPPIVFSHREGKSLSSFMYLGSDICGHPGIIHGGMLATLLDEGLARCCFPALPNKVGVTANLNVDYRAPAMADSYVVLRAETTKVEGRKAWVEGRIETLPRDGKAPVVLVEAKALFIEPKQAAVSFVPSPSPPPSVI